MRGHNRPVDTAAPQPGAATTQRVQTTVKLRARIRTADRGTDDEGARPNRSDRTPPEATFPAALRRHTLAHGGLPGISYAQALAARGDATWQVRTFHWVRDHGGTPAVNTIENWYYTLQAPSAGPPIRDSVPTFPPSPRTSVGQAVEGGPATALPVRSAHPSCPGRRPGFPAEPTATTTRPSTPASSGPIPDTPASPVLPGFEPPAPKPTSSPAPSNRGPVSRQLHHPDQRPSQLVAAFSSGWRIKDTSGGFYLNGRSSQPLIGGHATAACHRRHRPSERRAMGTRPPHESALRRRPAKPATHR